MAKYIRATLYFFIAGMNILNSSNFAVSDKPLSILAMLLSAVFTTCGVQILIEGSFHKSGKAK